MAARLAIFATILLVPPPTVTGSPTRLPTSLRRWAAISAGVPQMCSIPVTSRNASSSEIPSTTGETVRKTSNSSRLAFV